MKHIYWVGLKESEIQACNFLFEGSVTFIGTGKNGNISFSSCKNFVINYNEDAIELDNFMRETLHGIIEKVPDVSFLCYTASHIYSLEDPEISKHIICGNDRDTLQLLRNKMNSRLWLKHHVPVLPTIILAGCECRYESLTGFFPNEAVFTVQGCLGSGGMDTYIMAADNHEAIRDKLFKNHLYIISPYKADSYSVNVHVLFMGDEYFISPGSLQISEVQDSRIMYHGCDFAEYHNVPEAIQDTVFENSRKIAEKIQLTSYIGVLGIDYLIADSEVYFLEINPRFQSSTSILNLALKRQDMPSIQEMLLGYWYQGKIPAKGVFDNLQIALSNYIIDYEEGIYDYGTYIQNISESPEIESLVLDGYRADVKTQPGASAFSIIFNGNITSLNVNGSYNIYDNIRPFPMKEISLKNQDDCKWLKFSILNQGVCFSDEAWEQASLFQPGVYSSLDIYITDNFVVNAPTEMPFHSLSPFRIQTIDGKLALHYGKCFITYITIDKKKEYCSQVTGNGINYQRISFIATDRLRIHHAPNCLFQTNGTGCKFCDVPGNCAHFTEEDIREVIDWHLEHSDFRHILIGGASGDYPGEYVQILDIVKYIKSKTDKPIYIMSLPPQDLSVLDKYYAAGVGEVAFNIEIYNREYAKRSMPGKGKITLDTYKKALLHSVQLWGNTGNVRSLLVYGLEKDADFLQGVEWLASNGIQPIISPFRALRGTEYAHTVPAATERLIKIFEKANRICQMYHINLGPDCIYCQNNTLSFNACGVSPCDN